MVLYPGGLMYGLEKASPRYDPHKRLWYSETFSVFNNSDNNITIKGEMLLTGPYYDAASNLKTITISKAIIDMNNNFQGVAAIDMIVSDL